MAPLGVVGPPLRVAIADVGPTEINLNLSRPFENGLRLGMVFSLGIQKRPPANVSYAINGPIASNYQVLQQFSRAQFISSSLPVQQRGRRLHRQVWGQFVARALASRCHA